MEPMTQYEVYDLAISLRGEAQTTSGLFLTVVSGYLAIAYIVGAALSRTQVAIITGIFLVFTLAQVGGHYATMLETMALNRSVEHLAAPAVSTDIWPEIFLCIHLSIVIASLKFMWDVRHVDSG